AVTHRWIEPCLRSLPLAQYYTLQRLRENTQTAYFLRPRTSVTPIRTVKRRGPATGPAPQAREKSPPKELLRYVQTWLGRRGHLKGQTRRSRHLRSNTFLRYLPAFRRHVGFYPTYISRIGLCPTIAQYANTVLRSVHSSLRAVRGSRRFPLSGCGF